MIRTNGLIASLLMHAYISKPGSVHYSTMVTNAFKIDGPFKVFLPSYAAPLESVHDPTSAGKTQGYPKGYYCCFNNVCVIAQGKKTYLRGETQ